MPTSWGAGQVTDCGRTVGAAAGNTGSVRSAAVRVVCGQARDAGDAAAILEQLGLDPAEATTE